MQTRTIHPIEGLRQEGGVETMLGGNGFEHIFGRHQPISDRESIADLKVEFVLTGGHLMMTSLDGDVHLLQGVDHLSTDGGSQVGGKVEVATSIMWERRWRFVFRAQQQ